MQLRKLILNNFRSFSQESIYFDQRLAIFVGENNGGKSNIIDAIRLISTPLSGRRDIYCEETDKRFGSTELGFEISAIFSDLTPPQQGRLLSATMDDSMTTAQFGLKYETKRLPTRPALWAGRFKSIPEPGCHEMIRHVYLPPLRDAKRSLASGNPTRIYTLLKHFLGDRDPGEVAKSLARAGNDPILTNVDKAVTSGLDALTIGVRRQGAALGFNTTEKLIDIARDLRFKLADHGIAPEDLQYSGHGFANLLYMATIAVELENVDNADLTLFLVEEPEAHLHPQLQAAVLSFLEEQAETSLRPKPDTNAPAGHVQVIVATHSPNLSAWVPSKNLIFVRSVHPETAAPKESSTLEVPTQIRRPETRCIPLSKLDLNESDRRKVDRYLDVTKSALLFGGRVLLVEGIAEALLLPIIARRYVLKGRGNDLRTFRSSVFVPIDGIDFAPYIKILLTLFNGIRIADRIVVITDGDGNKVPVGEISPGSQRKIVLDALAAERSASSLLAVLVNTYSLESELVIAGNASIMKEVFLELHPKSANNWDEVVALTGRARAQAIQDLFAAKKGDFAQILAEKLHNDSDSTFVVPGYIRQAIEALVK